MNGESNRKILAIEQIISGINIRGLTYEHNGRNFPFQINPNRLLRGMHSFDTPFSKNILSNRDNSEVGDVLSRFDGQVVVELGAGRLSDGLSISEMGKARSYVGIEPYHAKNLYENLPIIQRTPISLVCDDSLSFLRRIPENSVSVYMAGVDGNVIPNDGYWKEVEKEIERVLNPYGGFVEYVSGDGFWNLRKNLKLHRKANVTFDINCWIK